MAYADQKMSGSRFISIIIVALIHVGLGYALITGLAFSAAKQVYERVTTVDIEEPPPPEEEPPPPPPDETPPPPIVAPPPPINVSVAPPPIRTVPEPPPAPVLTVAPPPPPSLARAAVPSGLRRWSARIQENYPSRAIRDETEGNVGVTVTVGSNGRVTDCRVSASSGSSVLDRAACQGMERYARFEAALDAQGNPTSGTYSTTIVYQLN